MFLHQRSRNTSLRTRNSVWELITAEDPPVVRECDKFALLDQPHVERELLGSMYSKFYVLGKQWI